MAWETYGSSVSDPGHCAVFKSPDGLQWTPIRNPPLITNRDFDSLNLAFWPTIHAAEALTLAGHGEEVRTYLQPEGFNSCVPISVRKRIRISFALPLVCLVALGKKHDLALIRDRLEDADNSLVLAFLQHALGTLGDQQGHQALIRNLASSDPAIRTYAAVFSGESAIVQAILSLTSQLDDDHLAARIRAEQRVLVLAGGEGKP